MSSLRWVWSNLILFTFRYLVLYQLIQNAQPAVSREMRERKRTVLLALQISIYLLSFPGKFWVSVQTWTLGNPLHVDKLKSWVCCNICVRANYNKFVKYRLSWPGLFWDWALSGDVSVMKEALELILYSAQYIRIAMQCIDRSLSIS